MSKLKSEIVRFRVTDEEKEILQEKANNQNTKLSELVRKAIEPLIYPEEEHEDDAKVYFIEKVKALKTLTGYSMIQCKYALLDSNGDIELAIRLLKSRSIMRTYVTKAPLTSGDIHKVEFSFIQGIIIRADSAKGEISITQSDIEKIRDEKTSIIDINITPNHTIEKITMVFPCEPTRVAMYDNIIAYIQNILRLSKSKNHEISPDKEWFNPIVATQNVADKLYQLINTYEEKTTLAPLYIDSYRKKIVEIMKSIYGVEQ